MSAVYKECYCKKCGKYKTAVGFEPVHINGKYVGQWCEDCIIERNDVEQGQDEDDTDEA